MEAQLKEKWVEALRSGKYEQGKRALRKGNSFCCLGVLCDVMGAKWEVRGDDVDLHATFNGELQEYYFEPAALEVIGMTEAQQEELYQMNDEGESFAAIADQIEKNL